VQYGEDGAKKRSLTRTVHHEVDQCTIFVGCALSEHTDKSPIYEVASKIGDTHLIPLEKPDVVENQWALDFDDPASPLTWLMAPTESPSLTTSALACESLQPLKQI
jgi:hypothetical protein